MSKHVKQQNKLYEWERQQSWWYGEGWWRGTPREKEMTLPEIRRYIKPICARYHIKPPLVKAGRGKTAWGSSQRISLPWWARRPPVVLHELAHSIVGARHLPDHYSHGAIFTRMFIELVASYLHQDKGALIESAKAFGLQVAPWSALKAVPIL